MEEKISRLNSRFLSLAYLDVIYILLRDYTGFCVQFIIEFSFCVHTFATALILGACLSLRFRAEIHALRASRYGFNFHTWI